MQGDLKIIERCLTPRGELQLQRRGKDYEIISNGVFLMATYNGDSERQLVSIPLNLSPNPGRVLIAGLGFGFSLREALRDPRVDEIVVLEIEPKIIEWNHAYISPLVGNHLADSRIRIIQEDLITWLDYAYGLFDVVCIDIDNGPEWTVTESNCRLYTEAGLRSLAKILSPFGTIAFWSAAQSTEFVNRLKQCFGSVKEYQVKCNRGEPDYIYTGVACQI
jgi:spermidine synthase